MTATSTDERALLNAIAAHPDEDTPRACYLDWLDGMAQEHPQKTCPNGECRDGRVCVSADIYEGNEWNDCPTCNGSGTVPDTYFADRAEFVRVQTAAEELRAKGHGDNCPALVRMMERAKTSAGGQMTPKCIACEDLQFHEYRERELRALHEATWRAGPVCEACGGYGERTWAVPLKDGGPVDEECPHCHGTGDAGGLLRMKHGRFGTVTGSTWEHPVTFRHGFPFAVECRLADVVDASGAPSAWAKAVCRAHPVMEFRVSDREALRLNGSGLPLFSWYDGRGRHVGESAHHIPYRVWDALEGFVVNPDHWRHLRCYESPEAANTALACALARLAREAAR